MTLFDTLTQQSGSVGETVFSRNQHGPYTRDRTLPADPSSPQQVAVRAALTECVTAWRTVLTSTERQGWDAYALAVRTRTALGRSTNPGGLAMYVRANVPRIQAGVGGTPRVDQAPARFTLPVLTPIVRVVANFLDNTIHPFFAVSDPWVTQTDAALILWASRPQTQAVNFFNGPYRLAGTVLGSPFPVPTSPGTLPLPFPIASTDRVFVRLRLSTADAALTSSIRLLATPPPLTAPVPILATFTAGAFPTVAVQFDQPLRVETHDVAAWRVRWQNDAYSTTFAQTTGDSIQLFVLNAGLNFGIDRVTYTARGRDVHGVLNGLEAAPFTNFPLT